MAKVCDTTILLDQGGLAHMGLRRILQGLVLSMKPKVVVEIGTFRGYSSACMARSGLELKRRSKVQPKFFTVDPNKYGQRPAIKKFVGENSNVKCIFKRAQDVNVNEITLPIDILFIDGDHTYEATRDIYNKWVKWVRPGGIVVMHDICVEGPIKSTPGREYGVKKFWEEIDLPKVTLVDMRPGIGVVMVSRVEEPKEAKKLSVEPEDPTYKEEKPDPIPDFKSGIPDMPGMEENADKPEITPAESTFEPSKEWDAGATDMEKDEPEPKEAYNESESVKAEKSKPKRKYTRKK